MTTYTLSEWQAKVATEAQVPKNDPPPFLAEIYLDSPELHWQHVLPGAQRAITQTELAVWRAEGLSEADMVLRVNVRHSEANSQRMQGFVSWRDGERLERIRENELRQQARQQALMEFEAHLVAAQLARNAND